MSTVLQLLAVNGRPASSSSANPSAALPATQPSSASLNSDQLLQRLREQQARCNTPLFSSAATPPARPQTEYRRNFNRPFTREGREAAAHPLKASPSISNIAARPHSAIPPSNEPPLSKGTLGLHSPSPLSQPSLSQFHHPPPHPRPSSSSSSPSTKAPQLHTTHPVFNPRQSQPSSPPPVKPHACKPHRPGSILVPPPPALVNTQSGVNAQSGVRAHAPAAALKPFHSLGHNAWTGSMSGSRGSTFGDAAPVAACAPQVGLPRGVQPVPGAAGVLPQSKGRPATPLVARPASSPITHTLMEYSPALGKAVSPHHPPSKPTSLAAWPRGANGLNSSTQVHNAAAPKSHSITAHLTGSQACSTSPGADQAGASSSDQPHPARTTLSQHPRKSHSITAHLTGPRARSTSPCADQASASSSEQPHPRSPKQNNIGDEHAAAAQCSGQPHQHQSQQQQHQFHHPHHHQSQDSQSSYSPLSLAASPPSAPSHPPQRSSPRSPPTATTQPAAASTQLAAAAAAATAAAAAAGATGPQAGAPCALVPQPTPLATPARTPSPTPVQLLSPPRPSSPGTAAKQCSPLQLPPSQPTPPQSSMLHSAPLQLSPSQPTPPQSALLQSAPQQSAPLQLSPSQQSAPLQFAPLQSSSGAAKLQSATLQSVPQHAGPLQSLLTPKELSRGSSPALRPGSTSSLAWSTDVQVPPKFSPPSQAPPPAPDASGNGQFHSFADGRNVGFGSPYSSARGGQQTQNASSIGSSTWANMAAQEAAAQQHLEQLRGVDGNGSRSCSRQSSRASTPAQPPKASKEDEDCSSIDIVYSSARSSRASTPRLSTPQSPWPFPEPLSDSRPRTPLLQNKQLGTWSAQPAVHARSRLGIPEKAGVGLSHAAAGSVGHPKGQGSTPKQHPAQPESVSKPGWRSASHSQHAGPPAFVRQAAPMVLCLDDITKSSDEVLELEVKRKFEGLSLEDLKRLNSLL